MARELDDTIRRMIETDGFVVADICVEPGENCFPMIPSGAAHDEMILSEAQEGEARRITDEGMMLV